MEDILASIRRILNEDEVTPASPEAGSPQTPAQPQEPNAGGSGGEDDDGVLVLDEAMLVTAPQPGPDVAIPTAGGLGPEFALPPQPLHPEPPPGFNPEGFTPQPFTPEPAFQPQPVSAEPALPLPSFKPEPAAELGDSVGLLAPESAAAAASSVGALMRTITQERSSQVHRGGPTIEDVVREEVRPLLKQWLDHYLPPMVERMVRQEIERVTGRAAP